jgi:hypothetical protein
MNSIECKQIKFLSCQASKCRRAVSFAPPSEHEIYEVPHINDYSSELIGSIWYNEAEYAHIQTSCIKIIRKMVSDKSSDERRKKQYCSRGLEKFPSDRARARRAIRQSALEAVMDEQIKQWSNDVVDVARIADAYTQHCLDCKIEAVYTARRDELESNHVMRCKKKIVALTIQNSQKDKLEVHHHSGTPLHTTLRRNSNATPQA